jgi:ubiquinone/menaquinone biosynthesis C-methylase UbiE
MYSILLQGIEGGTMENSATDQPEPEKVRGHLHGMWSAVASAWDEHADYADVRGIAMTARLLELAPAGDSGRLLELACGPGGLGLAAAAKMPEGKVVMSDVAPQMVEIARRRAAERGLENVSTAVIDIEAMDAPDEAFDAVVCREGLMFALDPGRALREIHRVLAPGGRFAASVWGPRERNPWLGVVMDAASSQFGVPMPPPGIPGPFALSDSARLGQLAEEAGFTAVEVEELDVPTDAANFDDWWSRTTSLAGPLARIIENLPADGVDALREKAREGAASYTKPDGGLDFPGVTLIVTGQK